MPSVNRTPLLQDLPSHQHPVIVLRDTRFLELKCLLCFIYHGEVNVSQDNLSCLLNLAENLKVKGLAQEAPKRHHSKDYEYGGRRGLSPERDEDLSDGGEGLTPKHRGRLLRSEESNSPSPAPHAGFPSYPALGSLLGSKTAGSAVDDRNSSRDLRDPHMSKGPPMDLTHDRHRPLMHQERQQQQYSPPSKRRKRLSSPHPGQSPGGHNSSSSLQIVQQQSCNNQNSSRGISQISPPPTNAAMHNNSSSSSVHTPAETTNSHAVNLTVSQGSPPRLMIPKVEFIPSEEDSGNGDKERMERQEQRERLCNFLEKERIAGMISSKFSGGADSDMEGEEEPPPPHHDEDSGDMDSHTSSGGLPHPLSHQLPPGLQQSFVPYPQTTHAAAAAAAAAAAHHIANTFTPGPSGELTSQSDSDVNSVSDPRFSFRTQIQVQMQIQAWLRPSVPAVGAAVTPATKRRAHHKVGSLRCRSCAHSTGALTQQPTRGSCSNPLEGQSATPLEGHAATPLEGHAATPLEGHAATPLKLPFACSSSVRVHTLK
ncbi:BTB/POZ domain [Trinorchestia longiramus]|nr:BTB/POZ domain [Trinorchestia longiramus]